MDSSHWAEHNNDEIRAEFREAIEKAEARLGNAFTVAGTDAAPTRVSTSGVQNAEVKENNSKLPCTLGPTSSTKPSQVECSQEGPYKFRILFTTRCQPRWFIWK